ncbi:synaptonemal complex protein 2-like [Meriones unguiculatus]|uniref:synaptonemal complex protein 2-like n=1 Tax=Meriones unguiculatus TaxID=10047 RepID=UPI00293F069B|nr:synaptonemal complex protein 2-like [Meriones unguiculatus]
MEALQFLLTASNHHTRFYKIDLYLQKKESYVPQKHDNRLLLLLDRDLFKELGKDRFHNCSLLLRCIQRFFRDDPNPEEPLLIQQGLTEKITPQCPNLCREEEMSLKGNGAGSISSVHMVAWFEEIKTYLMRKTYAVNILLIKVAEDFLETAQVISKHSRKGAIEMLDSFLLSVGNLVAKSIVTLPIQQKALETLNFILAAVPKEEREKLSSAEGPCCLMKELARKILTVGDYSHQVALIKVLCSMTVETEKRNELADQWFEDPLLAKAFKEVNHVYFETDCRLFLNFLNERLGDQRRVHSFPCLAALAGPHQMRKPEDEDEEEKFWIDFNLGSQSVTFYIHNTENALRDSVKLQREAVFNFIIIDNDGMKLFIIYLKQPIIISKKEARIIEIYFDRHFDISEVSVQVLGEDKQVAVYHSYSCLGSKDRQSASLAHRSYQVFGVPTFSFFFRSMNIEPAEEATVLLPEFMDTEVDPEPAVSITNMEDRSAGSSKPDDSRQAVTSKHGYSSDVREVWTQTQAMEDSALERDREQNRRMLFKDRKHYILDSNEDSSSSPGKQSRVQSHRRKFLRTYPQKRKQRFTSIRILPLFPTSRGSAPEKVQVERTPKQRDISRGNETTLIKLSEAELQDTSVLLIPEASTQEIETPDESVVAPKHSRLEDAPGASAVTEISTLSQEDVPESANSSALKSAFENFTRDLKRKFEVPLKHKKIPRPSEEAKEVPGCLTRIWDEIHMSRLNMLERFHSSVLQHLSNLEKDLQTVKCLEKDVLEFWEKQSADF